MESHLWYIHGRAYDLNTFKYRHPGGQRALNMMRGQDCSEMFEAYHSLYNSPYKMMHQYEVKDKQIKNYEPVFEWDPLSSSNRFQNELRQEVRTFIKDSKLDIKMSSLKLFIVSLSYLGWLIFMSWYWLYKGEYWAAVLAPILSWIIGVNSFHDASHFCLSRREWVNNIFRYIYPWFSSPTTWDHQHVIAHHSYTNMEDHDPDLLHGLPFVKMHPNHSLGIDKNFHRVYRFVLWLAATFILSTLHDVLSVLRGSYHGVTFYQQMSWYRTLLHVFGRILSVLILAFPPIGWFVYREYQWTRMAYNPPLPLLHLQTLIPVASGVLLGLFWVILFYSIFGVCFMSQTQVNHITTECINAAIPNANKLSFQPPLQAESSGIQISNHKSSDPLLGKGQDEEARYNQNIQIMESQSVPLLPSSPSFLRSSSSSTKNTRESWAKHQVQTSLNFANHSYAWMIFSGGLNHQIEHHLFPGVSHEHLPLLKPIVMRLCQKHGVKYPYTVTYWEVIQRYWGHMDSLLPSHDKYMEPEPERVDHQHGL